MDHRNDQRSRPKGAAAKSTRPNKTKTQTTIQNTKTKATKPPTAGAKRTLRNRVIAIVGLLLAILATAVCAIPALMSPSSDIGKRGRIPELYVVPMNPNLYTTEADTYGTDLNVHLVENGSSWFNTEALLAVEGYFSVRYGKEKPRPGKEELSQYSWKAYLPERTEGYRVIAKYKPVTENGYVDIDFGEWIPAKPHDVVEVPAFTHFPTSDWSRLALYVVLQVKISDPVFTQAYDKDHGWTQTWRVGWAPITGEPKMPNWFSLGQREPSGFWEFAPEQLAKVKRIRATTLYSCEGCGALRGFEGSTELSRGLYAFAFDPNTAKSIEVLVPWRPWSWATPVVTWFLVGIGSLALASAVGRWKKSVTRPDNPDSATNPASSN